MKIIKKEYRPYGVLLITAEVNGKAVTRSFKAGTSETEIKKAFGAVPASESQATEPKKGAKK